MKRSLLIGAALVFSLSAVACSDDDDSPVSTVDAGKDAGHPGTISDGGLDGSVSIDSGTPDAAAEDAGHTDSGR
ncbi:MAG: hypothetical protein JWN04_3743 [Myxococcaceae bacterium]|nr:hypothetical protein [Myxococcaceae bacterium]